MTLRIQICPKKGISPIIIFWAWDWDNQSYSRKGSGFLGWWSKMFFFMSNDRGNTSWNEDTSGTITLRISESPPFSLHQRPANCKLICRRRRQPRCDSILTPRGSTKLWVLRVWVYKTLRIQTPPQKFVGLTIISIPSPCHRIGSGKSRILSGHISGSL